MPLALAENDATESGITYSDRTGVSYEYPKMYRRLVRPGERFVYYKGRRKHGGGRAPQVYFGRGIVGAIEEHRATGRLTCQILDYKAFPLAVPFKDSAGTYMESGGIRRGYFQQGVRSISEQDFERILSLADTADLDAVVRYASTGPSYAAPERARLVEEFSVRVAMEMVRLRYPNARAIEQPRNNPGFDILLQSDGGAMYVEVKGTERKSPQFFVTEGELQFSTRNASQYVLIVVYGIDMNVGSYDHLWHDGAISSATGFKVQAIQWSCDASAVVNATTRSTI